MVIIRDAIRNELHEIVRVVKESISENKAFLSDQLYQGWTDGIEATVFQGKGDLILAVENGKIIGCVQLFLNATQSTAENFPAGSASLRILSVLPKHRGKSIGNMLITECVRRSKKDNVAKLYLHSSDKLKRADRLFQKMGFKRAPEYDFYPYDPEDVVIGYCLEL
jgi:ribosomal protein S18 acetylase RimI-like enzyme